MNHSCTITVRSYELDTNGHVNNAVYLNYLEHGRLRFLQATGFPYTEFRRLGYGLFVARINLRYIRPAFLDDELTIRTTALSLGRVKGAVAQVIECDGVEILAARVDFATVNGDGRPAPMPPEVRQQWTVARDFDAP